MAIRIDISDSTALDGVVEIEIEDILDQLNSSEKDDLAYGLFEDGHRYEDPDDYNIKLPNQPSIYDREWFAALEKLATSRHLLALEQEEIVISVANQL